MTWIVEEPLYIAILGVVTLAFLGFAWMQTGYRALLNAAIGAAALTVGLLLLEYLVDTEPERIEATLHRIARDVERNDHEMIYSHVYSGAPETLAWAKQEFPRYRFERATIKRNLEIVLDMNANPPAAHASFNVRVDVTDVATGHLWYGAAFVEVTMRKEGDRWTVEECSYDEPTASMRGRRDSRRD
jgi:hypothetical protein